MSQDDRKTILICPLDWGLGHAARCIPVIKQLNAGGHRVIIAASGASACLLKAEFPDLEHIYFPGYSITYSSGGNLTLHFLLRAPGILFKIWREHRRLSALVKGKNIDIVISDNRYGLWNKKAYCVFITHQIMIKCPRRTKFMEPLLYRINRFFIRHYNECWVPDIRGEGNISGDLSHLYSLPENTRYIGWLSRFSGANLTEKNEQAAGTFDFLAVISGPEPQRSIFENLMIAGLKKTAYSGCIVRGTPGKPYPEVLPDNITIYDHLPAKKMISIMFEADCMISRPGYSTLMDLAALKKNAAFIPTPGQTEQEYLAGYLLKKKLFYSTTQDEFDLDKIKEGIRYYRGFGDTLNGNFAVLEHEIDGLLHA